MINTREIVLDLLLRTLEEKKFSHLVLQQKLSKIPELSKQDRNFITRLFEGTLERCITLDAMISYLSSVKLEKMKPVIRNLLRMGFYQLFYMDQVPDFAVCNEAVKLARKRGFSGLSGFINGILRKASRTKDLQVCIVEGKEEIDRLSILFSMPVWLTELFKNRFGVLETEKLFQAFYQEKLLCIRVNQSKISVKDLETSFQKQGLIVEPGKFLDEILYVGGFDSLLELPGYQEGYFQVQDESSALVGRIAGIKQADFILDICAAPGGKTMQIADLLLQQNGTGRVEARDISETKVNLILENRARTKFANVLVRVQDALLKISDKEPKADILIADLPCSGLGILSKKPDIKYNMSEEKQGELISLQRRMLENAKKALKPGGVLIFSTCTIQEKENEENVSYLVEELGFHTESLDPYLPPSLHGETTKSGYLQLLPHIHKTDGFFVARLVKEEGDR